MGTVWQQLFANQPTEPAARRYCIAFTPRSGSSWLEDLLARTGILGTPQEWFNPKAARRTVRRSGANSLPAYYDYLKRVMRTGDVFGVEMAWPHIKLVMESGCPDLFDDIRPWFLLRRRDFVAQGVSLYKAEQTGRYHSVQANRSAAPVAFNGREIAACILRMMSNEFGLSTFFESRQLQPTPLWYEDLVSAPAEDVVRGFIEALGLPGEAFNKIHCETPGSEHRKIGDAESEVLISRFRDEHPLFSQYWESYRGQRSVARFTSEHPEYGAAGQMGSGL